MILQEVKLLLSNDIKTSETRGSGMLEKWYVQALKIFGTGNLPSLVCNFSSNSFLRSLAKEAILICFIAAAFLHESNSSAFFSFAAITSLKASLANNFYYSPTLKFKKFSLVFSTTALYS